MSHDILIHVNTELTESEFRTLDEAPDGASYVEALRQIARVALKRVANFKTCDIVLVEEV